MKIMALFLLFISQISMAMVDGHKYQFDNKLDDVRFRALAEELRCPKCQNQNLADSNSPLAKDLRDELYRMVKDGTPDLHIMDFMVSRYGDFVRYRPEVSSKTWVLWYGPPVLIVFAMLIIFLVGRNKAKAPVNKEVDQQRLDSILDDEGGKS
jgi:cytochrome c-type biogenesis protein CcmH